MKKIHLIALAAAGVLMSGAAMAADQCSVEITGNDQMKYNLDSITVPASCKDFTVNLKHVGKVAKASMGHNWVLTTPADKQAVVTEALKAGPSKDYIPDDAAKILAHTKLIGGGESTSVTFPVSKLKAGQDYVFFCTFPAHATLMHGTLTVK